MEVNGSGSGSGYGTGYKNEYGSGYGRGYGDAYRDGDGTGYGNGYGYGYGDGKGYGYGYGYRAGYGDGDGDGAGYGYGSGYGYDDGDGTGYGNGYEAGNGNVDDGTDFLLALARQAAGDRMETAIKRGATIGFWRADAEGKPDNGGTGGPRTVGQIEEVPGPLEICTPRALHATLEPRQWKGERLFVVALYGKVQRQGDTMGALKREILAEVPNFYEF